MRVKTKMNGNRIFGLKVIFCALIVMLSLPFTGWGESLYYYEDFASSAAVLQSRGWQFNFAMSREFYVDNGGMTVGPSGGRLNMTGDPNNNNAYDQWFTGEGAIFRPADNSQLGNITASAEEPFGFTVVRYNTQVHRHTWTSTLYGDADDNYGKGLLEVWLAEDNGASALYDTFDNYVFFYDKSFNYGNSFAHYYNNWGYYNNGENDFGTTASWPNMTDIDGNSMTPSTTFRVRYARDNTTVAQEVGIRMCHDGDTATIYINLDPADDSGAYQNSWVKFAEIPVAWADDLSAYFTAESPVPLGPGLSTITGNFDNFYVRTVASNLVASISPRKVVTSANVPFTMQISPQNVATNDSGIGELYIKKPSGYGSWDTSTVTVNHPVRGNMTRQTTSGYAGGNLGTSDFYTDTRDGYLYIRFGMGGTDAANNVVTNGTIAVTFSLDTPSTTDSEGDNFEIFADCVKHSGTAQDVLFGGTMKYASTGKKRAHPVSTDMTLVKVYSQPQAYAKIEHSPNPLVIDNDEANFTVKVSTEGITGAPDISRVRIYVPDGFNVADNAPGSLNIKSAVLGSLLSTNNAFVTNINSSNFIYVYYTNINGLAGANGFDKIEFTESGTPTNFPPAFYADFLWQVSVDSTGIVDGTTWVNAGTNSVYSSQFVRVTISNAEALAYIYPDKTGIFPDPVDNANNYTFFLRNVGPSGNNITNVKISVPGDFTNISGLATSNGSSIAYSNSYVWVRYDTVLTTGMEDRITFTAIHSNTNVNMAAKSVDFILFADNGNSSGYHVMSEDAPKSWSVVITPPEPYGENTLQPPLLYTTAVTSYITNKIYNTSAKGVGVKMVKIAMSTNYFSSIVGVTSAHLTSQTNIVTNTANGTNFIYVYYWRDGSDLDSVYDNPTTPDEDTVIIQVQDKIDYSTFSLMPTNIVVPTYVFKITNDVMTNTKDYALCTIGTRYSGTNKLYIEYPEVDAEYYVEPNLIPSTETSTSVTFFITNKGAAGNRIHSVFVDIASDISTNIGGITGGFDTGIFNTTLNRLELYYTTPLDGGESDTVQFTLNDIVSGKDDILYITPDVRNDRGWKTGLSDVVTNKYGTINFEVPRPAGAGWSTPNILYTTYNETGGTILTQSFTLKVTNLGSGADQFNRVNIKIPTPLTGRVALVSSSRLGVDSQSEPTIIKKSITNIEVIYSNNFILADEGDTLTVTAHVSNLNSLPTNGQWLFYADNGFVNLGETFFLLTNAVSGSKMLYGTERITASNQGSCLTTDLSNNFTYVVKNGSTGGMSISNLRIKIPWPYSIDTSSIIVNDTFANASTNGSYLLLDYGAGLFDPGEKSTIKFTALKPILINPTNAIWDCEVYYVNDYVKTAFGNTKGNKTTSIGLPDAGAKTAMTPNSIGKDEDYGIFTLTLSNAGELGNNIYHVKIVPPYTNTIKDIITNMSSIVSPLAGTYAYYSNNGCIYVDYLANGTNLVSGAMDTITFNAYDNQTEDGFIGDWSVFVANYPNSNATIASSVMSGQSLEYQVIIPAYNSSFYVTPTQLSTVEESNTVIVYVNNVGIGTNNINNVRVYIDVPFITNNIKVTSLLGTSFNYGSNYVQVNYPLDEFIPSSNDTITLNMRDNISYGSTNTLIWVKAHYNTSGANYISSIISAGTNLLNFVMPDPDVSCAIVPNNVYTSQRKAQLTFRFINKGKGSNEAKKIRLYVPSSFTNGLTLASIQDSIASNVTLSNNSIFIMTYTNFTVDTTNDVILQITNKLTNTGSYLFESYAENGIKTTTTTPATTESKYLKIVKAPSAEVVTTTVYSTLEENEVELVVNNNTSGDSSVYYVRITLPNVYTNVGSASSTVGTVVSNLGTNLVVYYPSGLIKGDQDTISLFAQDNKDMYQTNGLVWKVEANNNTGYGTCRELYANSLKQNMVIPVPSLTNNILTSWFLIKTGTVAETNTFELVVSNTGEGANWILSNVIELPAELRTVLDSTISSSVSGSVISNTGTKLIVRYTNATHLYPGDYSQISFDFTNTVQLPVNVAVKVYSYNESSLGYDQDSITINFKSPQEPTEAYLAGTTTLYSIDHSADLEYQINNGMYDVTIQQVKIKFNTVSLKITNIYSEIFDTYVPYSSTTSNITLLYSSLGGLPSKLDENNGREKIHIYVVYTNTVNWTNDMTATVLYDKSIQFASTKLPSGEVNKLPVLVADFGRISGIVLPGTANPTVKLYYAGTSTVVTNKFGEQIVGSASSSTGVYLLDYVPQGTYVIGFSGNLYRETYLSNLGVTENFVTTAATCKMKRETFDPSSKDTQTSLCLDDMATALLVPAGTLVNNVYFSVDIWLTNLTTAQQSKAVGGTIKNPADPDSVTAYLFDMTALSGSSANEEELEGDVILKLHYDETNILNQGWTEDSLAIYYWREMTGEWVRIGGRVDKDNNFVIAKVSYLHKLYAIFGETGVSEVVSGFESVRVDPKVFTPNASDRQFKNMKLSFGFTEEQTEYEVKIYNLSGVLIRDLKRDSTTEGGYTQGEVYWDGMDEDDYPVKSGVYIYRIITGTGQVFSGTIIVAR